MPVIVDPRRRQQLGLPPLSYGAGTLNNAAPSFQGPAYYNQMFNRPLQDWSQFMPTNSPLAGGGGALYQTPWGYGTGGGSGWGGAFGGGGGMMGGGLMGGGYGGGYPGWGGGYPGGYPGWTQPGFPGGGGTSPGFIPRPNPTDPSLPGPRPGSDKANDLAAGRTHHPEMYDANDNWVGAEGGGAAEAGWTGGGAGGGGAGGVPWQDTFMAPLGNRLGWDFAGYDPGQGQDTGSSYEDYEDTDIGFMNDALSGPPVRGLLDDPVGNAQFPDDPMALPSYQGPVDSGLLAGQRIARQNAIGQLTGDPDFAAAANANAAANVDTFTGMPQVNLPGPQESWSAPVSRPAAAPVTPAWSPPSMTPTAPATPAVDNFSAMRQAQMKASTANALAASQAQAQQQAYDQNVAVQAQQAAAAQQQRYLANLDDESARRMNQMSQAQIANEMANQAAIRSGQGLLAADVAGDEAGYSESGMGQQAGSGHPGMR